MMARRRSLLLAGLLLALTAFAAACSSNTTVVVVSKLATGKISCNSIAGTIVFVPPLTNSGNKAEKTTVSINASGCSTSGSNVSSIGGGHGVATISDSTNSCAGIVMSKPVKVNIIWSPITTRPTTVSYSGYTVAANAGGQYGFALPETGGSATVSGSFGGSGSTSSAATYSDSTATQISTACGSTAGLVSLSLKTGNVSIG